MLSCHPEPFTAFCAELQIPGCEVHLYKGPNAFGGICRDDAHIVYPWWNTENVYFLPGVKPGLSKRAADSDVTHRKMFTIDFDIRNELKKTQETVTDDDVRAMAEKIIDVLEPNNLFNAYRYAVLSGNGLHLHYFAREAFPITKKEEWSYGLKDFFTKCNKVSPIPCDMGCSNVGRIMRMPGSWNVKDPTKKKPVDFLNYKPGQSLFSMEYILREGAKIIAQENERKAQERAAFISSHPAGGSDAVDLINAIPIEQVIKQLFGCEVKQVKKDGGMRFADEKGVERGFFKHARFNIIVHEGTSLFPPPSSGIGYNCLSLVKAVLGMDAATAIQWFCERSTPVREAQEREKRAWVEQNQTEVVFQEYSRHRLPHA